MNPIVIFMAILDEEQRVIYDWVCSLRAKNFLEASKGYMRKKEILRVYTTEWK
jgi:hypothetical protein